MELTQQVRLFERRLRMSSHEGTIAKIVELERRCATLQAQLDKMKVEQTNYLQNVSHQLVAPLNAIKWHIENLTTGRLTNIDRAKKVLRSIYSQSTIAVHLAKNFALMSNLEEDHRLRAMKEPLEPISLCRLVGQSFGRFPTVRMGQTTPNRVEPENFEKAPDVLAIKPLISQAFSNIIRNAVKYSDKYCSKDSRFVRCKNGLRHCKH